MPGFILYMMLTSTPKFSYYSGTGPCKDEASEAGWCKDETSAAPIAAGDYGGSSGDVFWSPHYNKWVAIFMSGDSSGSTFWVSYSTTPHAHGPYTEAQKIFDPSWGNEGNYGGHGHSKFFGIDAKDVLLSWTVNGTLTEMAKLTFDP